MRVQLLEVVADVHTVVLTTPNLRSLSILAYKQSCPGGMRSLLYKPSDLVKMFTRFQI